MPEITTGHNSNARAECWHVVSGGVRMAMIAPPTITKCAAPKSSKRQRDGLAIYPVSRQLVRRLLIEPLMSSGWPYDPDDPDQQDCADEAGN